ncbi:MAG: S-methyl-5'-thioinosine phosphorylase [Halioglobus sp.]
MRSLAVIGGTGIDQWDGLAIVQEHVVETPFGATSRPVQEGLLHGRKVFFLQRHGSPKAIPPHAINYRANVWALNALCVTDVIAINAVGGIAENASAGTLVIPDQLIDYTWGREHTFDTGESGSLAHIDFTQPFDPSLRSLLCDFAAITQSDCITQGVYGVTQGPRLETAAEIHRMANDGCTVVGMTAMPEAALARELSINYASLCIVVNAAAGLSDQPLTLTAMRSTLECTAIAVRDLLAELLQSGRLD